MLLNQIEYFFFIRHHHIGFSSATIAATED
jgi:hypothetical protein